MLWAVRCQSARWHVAAGFARVAVETREREAWTVADRLSARSAMLEARLGSDIL